MGVCSESQTPQLLNEQMSLKSIRKDSNIMLGRELTPVDCSRHLVRSTPLTAKDWSPNVVLVDGTYSIIISDNDLKPRW